MATAKVWISAFRLRTLFLAMATVILGSGLAWHEGNFSLRTFIIASILAVTIQILANLANDLGDFQKGADVTGKRQGGPTRAIQSGKISPPLEMKRAIFIFSVISVVTGLSLVISVLDYIDRQAALILIGLGGASILAALFTRWENLLMVTEAGAIFSPSSSSAPPYLLQVPFSFIPTHLVFCRYYLQQAWDL